MRRRVALLTLLVAVLAAGIAPPLHAAAPAADAAAEAAAPEAAVDTGYLPYAEPRALEPVNLWSALARSVIALGIVLGLLGGTLVLLRRWLPGVVGQAGAHPVRVIGRVGLAPRQTVYLLHVAGRVLIVGSGGGQLSTLGEITDPAEVAVLVQAASPGTMPGAAPFAGLMARGLRPGPAAAAARTAPREDAAVDAIRRQIANLRDLTRSETR